MKKLYKKKSQIKCIHYENIRANRIVSILSIIDCYRIFVHARRNSISIYKKNISHDILILNIIKSL